MIPLTINGETEMLKFKTTTKFPDINLGGETDHSKLTNLDYESSGHTGFASSEDIPTKISQLENDKNYIDSNVSNLVNYEVKGNTGTNLSVSIDPTTFIMTIDLKNTKGDILSSGEVDLPIESMVVSARYDSDTKELILILQNESEVRVSVADLVSGLVSEETFDTAIDTLNDNVDSKFDLPYYYEYSVEDTDYEDTTEETLELFNNLKTQMENGERPTIIIRKGISGSNTYQTYHLCIPQFGTLDTAYILIKGSPIRQNENTFNLVALNCERDPETNTITRVYEKLDEGNFTLGNNEYFYLAKQGTDTSNETLKLFNEICEKFRNGEHPKLLIITNTTSFKNYEVFGWSTPLQGSFASEYYVFKTAPMYATQQSGVDYWENILIKCVVNSTTDPTITSIQVSIEKNFFATRYGEISTNNTSSTLSTGNTYAYTPTSDYNPATKKYVDDTIASKTTNQEQLVFANVFDDITYPNNIDMFSSTGSSDTSICQWFSEVLTKMYTYSGLKNITQMGGTLILSFAGANKNGITMSLYYSGTDGFFRGIGRSADGLCQYNLFCTYTNSDDQLSVSNVMITTAPISSGDVTEYSGYDNSKTQVLKNVNGSIQWVDTTE